MAVNQADEGSTLTGLHSDGGRVTRYANTEMQYQGRKKAVRRTLAGERISGARWLI